MTSGGKGAVARNEGVEGAREGGEKRAGSGNPKVTGCSELRKIVKNFVALRDSLQ